MRSTRAFPAPRSSASTITTISSGAPDAYPRSRSGGLCSAEGDFMAMPFAPDSRCGVCYRRHLPRPSLRASTPRSARAETAAVCVEWCMTERFDRADPLHQQLREGVAAGNGLRRSALRKRHTRRASRPDRHRGELISRSRATSGTSRWRGASVLPVSRRARPRCINRAPGAFERLRVEPRGLVPSTASPGRR